MTLLAPISMRVGPAVLTLVLVLCLGHPLRVSAQSLSANGGTSLVVPAGEDFATTVIGDPWDFSGPEDYTSMFSTGWAGVPTVTGGDVRGVVAGPDASNPSIQVQFEGVNGALNLVGRSGVTFPIDAARYRRVSFRMRRTPETSHPLDSLSVLWYTGTWRIAQHVGGKLGLTRGFDPQHGRYLNQAPVATQTTAAFHIYKLDLDTPSPFKFGVDWAGTARGLAIELGEGQAPNVLAGSTIEVDWVRLTRRGSATVQLAWSGFVGAVALTASSGADVIQIFPDDGTASSTFGSSGAFAWDYGFLPPGVWTVTVAGTGPSGGAVTRQVTLNIQPEPVLQVIDPDASGGQDYARTFLGDAWDLTNSEDVTRFGGFNSVASPVFGPAGLTGYNTTTDPSVELIDDSDKPPGTEAIIDANRYRHLTFTLEYDHKEYDSGTALGQGGGQARVIWRRAGNNGGGLTNTQDIVLLDGEPSTFSMDLGSFTSFGGDGDAFTHLEVGHGTDLWAGPMAVLRIDPHEPFVTRWFRLADVKLAADDEPNGNGFFTVRWSASDAVMTGATSQSIVAGVANADVALYYDTDTNPGNGKTLIVAGVPAVAGAYLWNLGGVPPGRYFVYAEVTTALGVTRGRYSTGPILVSTAYSFSDKNGNALADAWESQFGVSSPSGDEDDDGVANLSEFRAGTDPTIPNTWSLPEGATGFFRERLALANPGTDSADVTVTYLPEGAPPIVRQYSVVGLGRLTIDVNSVAGLADASVSAVVTATRGSVVVERTMIWDERADTPYGGHTGKGITGPGRSWFLAEGDTSAFDTFLLFANDNAAPARATVTYLLTGGSTIQRTYVIDPRSRFTVHANSVSGLAGRAFSTKVSSDRPIAVERAMYFGSSTRLFNGGHATAAVAAPASQWFVAEGRTGPFFDTYLLLANPGPTAAQTTIRYLTPAGGGVTETRTLLPTSRTTIHVDSVPGLADTDVSASISSTQPIVVERSMFWPGSWPGWYEGHNSTGLTATGTRLALAEGETGGGRGRQTFILLANPGSTTASVTVAFLREHGRAPIVRSLTVPPSSRLTVSAAQLGVPWGEKFGALITSTVPIAVERAMYWDAAGEFWSGGTNETAIVLR